MAATGATPAKWRRCYASAALLKSPLLSITSVMGINLGSEDYNEPMARSELGPV
jgi:hypothetical protein